TLGTEDAIPSRAAASAIPVSGTRRFRSTSTPSALSGETYSTRTPGWPAGAPNISRSRLARNAASVFPEPVGASKSADLPSWSTPNPCSWTFVGRPSARRNHSPTGRANRCNTSSTTPPSVAAEPAHAASGVQAQRQSRRVAASSAEAANAAPCRFRPSLLGTADRHRGNHDVIDPNRARVVLLKRLPAELQMAEGRRGPREVHRSTDASLTGARHRQVFERHAVHPDPHRVVGPVVLPLNARPPAHGHDLALRMQPAVSLGPDVSIGVRRFVVGHELTAALDRMLSAV